MCRSVPQIEAVFTRTSTSVGPIDGTATVSICKPLPACIFRNAFIVVAIYSSLVQRANPDASTPVAQTSVCAPASKRHRLKSVPPVFWALASLVHLVGAGPFPIFGANSEACLHRISLKVCAHLLEFSRRPNPMIERLILPEYLSCPTQDFVRRAGRAAFDQLGDPCEFDSWFQQDVHMIWHHDIGPNLAKPGITGLLHCFDDQCRNSPIA